MAWHLQRAQTPLALAQFTGDKLFHAGDLILSGRIVGKKFFRDADRAQRQTYRLMNALAVRQGDLATAPAHIDQQAFALCAGFFHHPAMDQPRLFEAGNDLHFPTRLRFHPRQEGLCVTCIAQRRSGDCPHVVGAVHLGGPVEPLERNQRAGHRLRRDHARFENTCP
jgi:hypothetical protein